MENAAAVPTIALTRVESSRIHSIGHHPESNTLAIRFLAKDGESAGSLYHYSNYPATEFEKFQNADSIGGFFTKHIKPLDKTYPYQRIEE